MAIILGMVPRKHVSELETDEVQVFKDGRSIFLYHVADVPRHVEHDAVLVDGIAVVLNFDGDAVARRRIVTVVCQEQVWFRIAVPEVAGDKGIHDFRMFDAVWPDKVQRRVDEVRREGNILLAR